jgi:hypothetical protein
LYNKRCTVTDVRRSELEEKLRALGWAPTGLGSGKRHDVWAHQARGIKLYVPLYDLILDSTAERILADAEG